MLYILLVVAFFLGFLPISDTDFGWHYRCGLDLINNGNLCDFNEYSYYLPKYFFAYPSWLFDSSMAIVFNKFGFVGLSLLGALLFTAIIYILIKDIHSNLAKILAGVIFFIGSLTIIQIGYRPQIWSVLFTFLVYLFVKYAREALQNKKSKTVLFSIVFLIHIVWANTHGGFFLGLIIILIEALTNSKQRRDFLLLFIISFIATLINPFRETVYFELLRHYRMPLNTLIAEWVSPSSFTIITIIVLLLVYLYLLYREKRLRLNTEVILLLLFAFITIKARRNLPYLFWMWPFVMFNTVNTIKTWFKKWQLPSVIYLGFVSSVMLLALLQLHNQKVLVAKEADYCKYGFKMPVKLVKKNPNLKGNIYNAYEWGGYLIWQYPKAKVFVDGRMPAWFNKHNESPYTVYLGVIQARKGWNIFLRKMKTDYLIIQSGTFLDLTLNEKAKMFGWEQLYRDKIAVLYKRLDTNKKQ
jgi:hypothetical protein